VLAGLLIHWSPASRIARKPMPLSQALADLASWHTVRSVPLQADIVEVLKLDDYVNRTYSDGRGNVSLFIGYYLGANNVGTPHSPLVCFPGQGWVVSDQETKQMRIGPEDISLTAMVAQRGEARHLVLYWFQAFDKTFPGTFSQKLYAAWARLIRGREDNAFVRVSVPIGDRPLQEAMVTGTEFIKSLYPPFLQYVEAGT
jgi:EpsI family protein